MPELDGYQVLEHIRSDPSRFGTHRRSWSRRSSTSETLNAGSLVDKLTARRALPSRRIHEHPGGQGSAGRSLTKEYGSRWIFEPRLTCSNALR